MSSLESVDTFRQQALQVRLRWSEYIVGLEIQVKYFERDPVDDKMRLAHVAVQDHPGRHGPFQSSPVEGIFWKL
jgi:hypothetical protein